MTRTRHTVMHGWLGFGALAAALSGCAAGPDFKAPSHVADVDFGVVTLTPASGQTLPAAAPRADWWTDFHYAKLNAAVEAAIRYNPTLTAADAALRQARQLESAQRAAFFPTISASFEPSRQQIAGNEGGNSPGVQGNGSVISTYQNSSGPPYNAPVTYNFYTSQVALSYTFDVFGLNRRQVEALRAQTDYQRDELDAAYLTLAANVVEAAITEASLDAQVEAQQAMIDDADKSLHIVERQFADGAATRLDVAGAQSTLAQAQAGLPPLRKQLDQTHDLLAALTGISTSNGDALTFDLAAFAPTGDTPQSVPADRVEQRPDVRAATDQWHSANAQLGVAVANRLPQFSLTADYGGAASQISQMFSPGGPFWSLIGDASMTVFDGGALRDRQLAAKAGVDQARAQYKSALISALQNVADALHAIRADDDAYAAAAKGVDAAQATLTTTQSQLETGYAMPLAVLAADQSLKQSQMAQMQAQQARLDDRVGLYQALAGRWQ